MRGGVETAGLVRGEPMKRILFFALALTMPQRCVIPPRMFSAERKLVVAAPAKINLSLEILGRRPDGYHDLRSVVAPVALADEVTLTLTGKTIDLDVQAAQGISLERLGPPEENLACRAARLLQEKLPASVPAGVHIRILKKIPIGGGLGGGSADAAAVLAGLARLCELDLNHDELLALGAVLGSDVPALVLGGFVRGGMVLMEGRGEKVSPLPEIGVKKPHDGFWVVVANPGFPVPTCDAYRLCHKTQCLTGKPNTFNNTVSSVRSGNVFGVAAALFNGLEAGVFTAYPETARLAARLKDAGGLGVLLSGSGASVFALVRDEAHGQDVRRRLGDGVWSVLTKTLPDGVMVAHGPLEP